MLQPLDKYDTCKTEEKEERFTDVSASKASTYFSSIRGSCTSPSIKLLGFRNFVPSFDLGKLMEEEPKLIKDPKELKDLKLEYSPVLIKLSKPDESSTTFQPTIVEIYESGPFLIFTYGESSRNGHPKDLLNLENIQIDHSMDDHFLSEELFVKEDGQFMMKVKDTDCIYIVPKEAFAEKMTLYSITEDSWMKQPVKNLKAKIDALNNSLKRSKFVEEENLKPLGSVYKGAFGESYRSYCKNSKEYYGIKCVYIKSPEILALVFQELDILSTVLRSQKSDLIGVLSLKVVEKEHEPLCLKIVFDLGLGTLEEFAAFKCELKEQWEEEELLRVASELLKQYRSLNELKVSIRDIRPANVILSKDFKSLRFADFGLAYFYEKEGNSGEIAGAPRFMAFESLKAIDQCTIVRHDTSLAELYSIGRTIIALAQGENEDLEENRMGILTEASKDIMRENYPILWDKYLSKLLAIEPLKRREVLKGFRPSKGEFFFVEKRNKQFQNYLMAKEFNGKDGLLLDFDAVLPSFWKLENWQLINQIEKSIICKFKLGEIAISKVRRFFEKLATLHENDKNYIKTIEIYEHLASLLEEEKVRQVQEEDDHKEDYNPLILELHGKIGGLYRKLGDFNKALENYEKALYFEYLKDPEDFVYDFKNHIEIGGVYEELNHSDLALDTYSKVQERFRETFKKNTNQLQEAILAEKMGRLYFKKNELLVAAEEIGRAIASYEACYGKHHESVGICERLLGDIFKKAGDHEEAIRQYEIYFHNHLHGHSKYDPIAAGLIEELGDYHQDRRVYERAVENYKKALHIFHYNDEENGTCRIYEKIAECYGRQKRYILAVKTLRECYQIKLTTLGENNLELASILEKIADNLVQDGEHKEALQEYSNALCVAMIHKANDDPLVIEILKKIGKISPLAFLAYKNYRKNSSPRSVQSTPRSSAPKLQVPVLISLNAIEDVRGVIGGIDFGISLEDLREIVVKECAYLKFFKYSFVRQGKTVELFGEKNVKLEECVVMKDGFNHLVIEESKGTPRERFTM